MHKIKSDDQRHKAMKRIAQIETDIKALGAKKGTEAAALLAKTLQPHVAELHAQIEHYDSIKAGIAEFDGDTLAELGSYLIDARIAAGITQAELSKKIGVSQPMVFKYENSEYNNCDLGTLQKVCDALGVKFDFHALSGKAQRKYDPARMTNLSLFFLNDIQNSYMGKTKLNKLLYYSDFEAQQLLGHSLTGSQYIANHFGPVPQNIDQLLKKMIETKLIHAEETLLGDKKQTHLYAKVPADMTIFTREENNLIVNISKRYEFWTASQMSRQTHEEFPWRVTPFGEIIDYTHAMRLRDTDTEQ